MRCSENRRSIANRGYSYDPQQGLLTAEEFAALPHEGLGLELIN
jgi:hypothetical protein